MKSKEKIIEYFNNLPEVIRLKELKNYIESNKNITTKFEEIKDIQKKIVNAKEFNQFNQLKVYELEYKKLNEELLNIPFVEEYLELMDYVNSIILNLEKELEFNLNKKINS